MEGCSKYCSFCVVPYTRGEEVSRPFDDVIAEVATLAAKGVREVNLLGQNVNAYRGPMADGELADLALLIEVIAGIEGIGRIRFTTSHPVEFNDRLVEAYARVPKLANYLHLPVQSGSDRILAAMKRGHTALEYKHKLRKLRAVRPDIAISTDLIVGFPGETAQDFEATLKLVEDVGFDQSFSFIYSRRPGTPAASLPDEVPAAEKQERLARLQAALNANAARISAAMVGSVQRDPGRGPQRAPRARTVRQDREQPHRELRRRCAPHRPVRRRGDHRDPAQFAARPGAHARRRGGGLNWSVSRIRCRFRPIDPALRGPRRALATQLASFPRKRESISSSMTPKHGFPLSRE